MAIEEMKPEAIKEYISNHRGACPSCGSKNIDVDDNFREYSTDDGAKIERSMWCNECEKEWGERYILTDIYYE